MGIKSFDTELTEEEVQDFVNNVIQAGNKIDIVYDDPNNTLTINTNAQNTEEVQDIVGGMLKEGNAISLNYNDSANELTVAVDSSGISLSNLGSRGHGELTGVDSADHHTRYTNEEAQDTVSSMLVEGSAITLTYDDSNDKLTVAVDASEIDSSNWGDYEIQKNGTDGSGIINFKT